METFGTGTKNSVQQSRAQVLLQVTALKKLLAP